MWRPPYGNYLYIDNDKRRADENVAKEEKKKKNNVIVRENVMVFDSLSIRNQSALYTKFHK